MLSLPRRWSCFNGSPDTSNTRGLAPFRRKLFELYRFVFDWYVLSLNCQKISLVTWFDEFLFLFSRVICSNNLSSFVMSFSSICKVYTWNTRCMKHRRSDPLTYIYIISRKTRARRWEEVTKTTDRLRCFIYAFRRPI